MKVVLCLHFHEDWKGKVHITHIFEDYMSSQSIIHSQLNTKDALSYSNQTLIFKMKTLKGYSDGFAHKFYFTFSKKLSVL